MPQQTSQTKTHTNTRDAEFHERVAYAMLLPAVRVARVLDLPLRAMGDWLHMAYFHELKRSGYKMRESADLLGVSMRKVALLSKRLKENFLRADAEAGLPRRVEFVLWSGPQSRARIQQAFPAVERAEVNAAIAQLIDEGRITQRRKGTRWVYEVSARESRLIRNDWSARLDALNNLLGNVCHAAFGRLFRDEANAFVRTVSFRIRKRDVAKLRALYNDVIWKQLSQLEAAAADADEEDTLSLDYSICWAPVDYLGSND